MKFKKKLLYLIFIFQFLLVPFSFKNSIIFAYDSLKSYSKNSPNIINDAIEPPCVDLLKNNQINDIKIEIPQSRKWQINLFKAATNLRDIGGPGYITDKFKKRFKAFISYNNGDIICKNNAKIRVSGDYKDHIEVINSIPVSSLDISLKDGSINGITQFKLFLPVTRNGDSEVFVANLFSELGLLSPRTRMINVEINNIKVKMIFQEKLAKELVENNFLRESILVKINDSIMWDLRDKNKGYFNSLVYPGIINNKWLTKGEPNLKIGIKALNRLSVALEDSTKDFINSDLPFDLQLLNGFQKNERIIKEQSFFSLLSIVTRSTHLNYKQNRRYYYDAFNDSLIPVYYDGNSEILSSKVPFNKYIKTNNWNNNEMYLAMLTKNHETYDFPYAIKRLKSLNINNFQQRLNKSGLKITSSKLTKIKKELIDNLNYLYLINQNIKESKNLKKIFKKEDQPKNKEYLDIVDNIRLVSGNKFSNLKVCNINSDDCKSSNFLKEDFYKIAKGNFVANGLTYFFFNKDNKFNNLKNRHNKIEIIEIKPLIKIKVFGNPELLIKEKEKKIDIIFKSSTDKIIFFDSKLINWDINAKVYSNLVPPKYDSRIDENLLTGTLTIQNSDLENLKIYFENGVHEDSVNIIQSTGSIKTINVKNSFQDAIDLDFSNLFIERIEVDKAGNDCLDISAGTYRIDNINSSQCIDKAISVGESSKIKIDNLEVDSSGIGIVIKDSSYGNIKQGKVKNSKMCLALYRKKQEFSGSYLEIPKQICDENKIFIQKNSLLRFL